MRGRKNPPFEVVPVPEDAPLTFDAMAQAYLEEYVLHRYKTLTTAFLCRIMRATQACRYSQQHATRGRSASKPFKSKRLATTQEPSFVRTVSRERQCVGTRRFNSSNQFWTTLICVASA